MEPNKSSMLFEMIDDNYGTRFSGVYGDRNLRSSSLSSSSSGKKRKSVLNRIKKAAKFENGAFHGLHLHHGFPTTGTAFIRKWKNNLSGNDGNESTKENNVRKGCCDNKLEWLDPPQDSLPVEFCQDTSLHGLKYILQPERHMSERIFWFITFAVGLSVAIWLISQMWNKYNTNPIIVSFQPFETNVDQIPFPAVTVCNMNKVMKSKANDYIRKAKDGDPEAIKDVYYLDHVCTSTQSFSRRFNFNSADSAEKERDNIVNNEALYDNLTKVTGFLAKAAQNCSEMIRLCVWEEREYRDCSDLFRPIETEFGKCCTFNMIPLSLLYTKRNDSRENPEEIRQWEKWDIDRDGLLLSAPAKDVEFPRRQMKAGLSSGLSLLLNVDSAEYYCTSSDSYGFRMATHLPVELPKVADFGISLSPKSEIYVDVVPQITMVDPEIFAFNLHKRNCYKTGEYKLNHFLYYSVNNCIDECIANETKSSCGCKRYYMPRNTKEPLCGQKKFDCAEEVRSNKSMNGIRNSCPMCYQSCTEVIYEPQTTSTPLRNGIWKTNETDNAWKEEDLTIVHVYIGEDSFYAKVRGRLYGPTDLFANTGGLMGLCLGFSGLSLIEVIYFLTLRAWWKSKRKKAAVVVTDKDDSKWAQASNINVSNSEGRAESTNSNTRGPSYCQSIFGDVKVGERQ